MTLTRRIRVYQKRYVKYDLIAGFVVFLIAIPLCLGIALASGAPLISGLISGVIGGIVVGTLSQSSISVSGPAAGLIALVLAAITQLGSFPLFLTALVLAGLFQILFGVAKAGFLADYIPSNVIQGLLCAIGILIIIKQLPFAFTHPQQQAVLLEQLKEAVLFNFDSLRHFTTPLNEGAVIITLLSIALLIYGEKTGIKRLKKIPTPILVVILGVIINQFFIYFYPFLAQNGRGHLVSIPIQKSFNDFLQGLSRPDWQGLLNYHVYFYGLVIAMLASIETLLNLQATEKLDLKRRYVSRNRELVSQGIGNLLNGLVGGLPITSVIVRSSVNIQSGAKTKFSAIWHGLLILAAILLFPKWINAIPLASLAGILIFIGYKLAKVSIFVDLYRQGYERFIPFIATVIAIIATNLLLGVMIGLLISLFFILKSNSQQRLDIIREIHPVGIIQHLILPQQVTFLNKAGLIAELSVLPAYTQLIIDASHSEYIDKDILELVREFTQFQAADKKISVNLQGFKPHYKIHNQIEFLSVTTHEIQSALTPANVLDILQEGNQRFINGQRINRNFLPEIQATSKTQHPIAVVLGCIDSRVPVETIFDMGLGDLFCVRVAGNVINDDVIGSIEFACLSGAKLIIILGHTHCGAIKAACDGTSIGYVTELLEKISPAIDQETTVFGQRDGKNAEFVYKVTQLNIENSQLILEEKSAIIREYLQEERIALVTAMYDIGCGKVAFAEKKLMEEQPLEILTKL